MNNSIIILTTIAFSALFSGMEIAFLSSNKLKIELDKGKGSFTARILSGFYREPSHLLGAMLVGNNIALVIYGIVMANIFEPILLKYLPPQWNSEILVLLLQTIIATLVIILFGEFLPKALFRINPNRTLNFFAIPLIIVYYLLYPVVYLFTGLSQFLLRRFFGIHFTKQEPVFTSIDLDQYLQELARDEEKLEDVQQEIQMVQNVIGFRTVKLRETMVPRTEIIAVEENEPIDVLRETFIEHRLSRIPVYSDTIDNITGYAHSFDMFRNPPDIRSIKKQILFIPETMPANAALTRFIHERQNIAVVVDEFGGTSGMVTMEDIMEEIFGEIEDEFDAEELIEKMTGPGEYIFSARLEIDYLNDKYRLGLPESDDYETLAGLILQHHENIPETGETIWVKHFRFDILQASEARIDQVMLVVGE
jgi:CBS domain containing-hemolysin-like protein